MRQAANFCIAHGLSPCDLTGQTTTYGNILAQPPLKSQAIFFAHYARSHYARANVQLRKHLQTRIAFVQNSAFFRAKLSFHFATVN
jgi:hypothetical protein